MENKYFVQYLVKRSEKLVEPCGSDSVFILDGRNKFSNMVKDGKEQANRLQAVAKFDALQVRYGTFSKSIKINDIISIKNREKE